MLSVMIYPLWHWELLWRLAQHKLVAALSVQVSEKSPAPDSLHTNTFFFFFHHHGSELHAVQCIPFYCERNSPHGSWGFMSLICPPSPICHTVSPPVPKLHLNSLPGYAEWQFHVFKPKLNSCGLHYGPVSPGHFFPLAVEAESHISPASCPPPPSCCLLSFLVSPMNPVNTEALFTAAVVSLSHKTEPSQASSLCSAPTRVSGLPLLLTGKGKRAAKRQSHSDWCCLRLCIPPNGCILWLQAVLCFCFAVVSVARTPHVSLVPPTGALVTIKGKLISSHEKAESHQLGLV